jgi:hypothetical protein
LRHQKTSREIISIEPFCYSVVCNSMKYTLTFLVLFKVSIGLSQFSYDSTGFAQFERTFIDYCLIQASETEFETMRFQEFNQLPSTIESLEKDGYKLQFVVAVASNAHIYFKRDSLSSILSVTDSIVQRQFSTYNEWCTDGNYFYRSVGEDYYFIHGTRPTGVVNELKFYLIKEE